MHPILTQALVADRVREWHDRAARDRLVRQARQARRAAALAAGELPGPRSGSRWPTRRQPVVPAAEAPVAVASRPSAAGDDRQAAGARAA
jgi:hypothetical protein